MPDELRGQLLAFDFGLRQIGVASAHTDTAIASPVTVLKARNGEPEANQIRTLISEWKPGMLLVGLPLNMDDSESELSRRARRFGRWLGELTGLTVEMVDERLTSREAKAMAGEQGQSGDYKRKPVDAIAACLILEQWLAHRVSG